MKRPLCFISLIITAIVFIYLEFSVSTLTNYSPVAEDGSFIEMTGIVSEKEVRLGLTGEEVLVIYLIPSDRLKGNFKYVECYLENDGFKPSVGEMVSLGGKVSAFSSPRNPGEFDSGAYLRRLGIRYDLKVLSISEVREAAPFWQAIARFDMFLFDIRDKTTDLFGDHKPLAAAIFLGDTSLTTKDVSSLFRRMGCSHLLAVSGTHLNKR